MRWLLVLMLLLPVQGVLGQQPNERFNTYDRMGRRLVPDPVFEEARQMERDRRGAEAVKTYIRSAQSGNADAARRLGEIYRDGIEGVAPNGDQSRKWFNAARALGEPQEKLQKPR